MRSRFFNGLEVVTDTISMILEYVAGLFFVMCYIGLYLIGFGVAISLCIAPIVLAVSVHWSLIFTMLVTIPMAIGLVCATLKLAEIINNKL